ncbi:sialidase family protein [Croceitalea dokdonensis]|nr:sialidase family protein [Croceitalea dokdonensis]
MKKLIAVLILGYLSISVRGQDSLNLKIAEQVEVIEHLVREPMFVEHPSGSLFVSGYSNKTATPHLWRSDDKGKTWNILDVGTQSEGADGNSDVDLAVDSQGTLYFITMRYTTFPENMDDFDFMKAKGKHIAVGVSKDEGSSWKWKYISKEDYDDRPWIVVDSDHGAHIIWNNNKGVHYVKSKDQGETWSEKMTISPKGGSSHFAAGENGLLAVRVSALSASATIYSSGTDFVSISKDNGDTWNSVKLPGKRSWKGERSNGVDRWVDPLAWDDNDILYHMWSENQTLYLGVSEDYGQNWNIIEVLKNEDQLYFPFLSIKNGTLAFSCLSGYDNDIRHHAGVINLVGNEYNVSAIEPLKLENLKGRFGSDTLSHGGEYFPIQVLKDGDLGMVTTIQDYGKNQLGFTWWRLKIELD